jgi:hypothetical protein
MELPDGTHVFPPFDLSSDMLFVVALTQSGPLRKAFPGTPFLSIAGRTPLVLWFSRVTEACHRRQSGERACLGGPDQHLYNEVNVMAILARRRLFCPVIYATSELSVRIAGLYGMPKHHRTIGFRLMDSQIQSELEVDQAKTYVRATLKSSGGLLAKLISQLWPVWTWPVEFPGRRRVQALIQATPRVQAAAVRDGRLELPVDWLARPLSFLPTAVYIPQLRMQLPPP